MSEREEELHPSIPGKWREEEEYREKVQRSAAPAWNPKGRFRRGVQGFTDTGYRYKWCSCGVCRNCRARTRMREQKLFISWTQERPEEPGYYWVLQGGVVVMTYVDNKLEGASPRAWRSLHPITVPAAPVSRSKAE